MVRKWINESNTSSSGKDFIIASIHSRNVRLLRVLSTSPNTFRAEIVTNQRTVRIQCKNANKRREAYLLLCAPEKHFQCKLKRAPRKKESNNCCQAPFFLYCYRSYHKIVLKYDAKKQREKSFLSNEHGTKQPKSPPPPPSKIPNLRSTHSALRYFTATPQEKMSGQTLLEVVNSIHAPFVQHNLNFIQFQIPRGVHVPQLIKLIHLPTPLG